MMYLITLSDDRQFAVIEEKLEAAKADLAKYSENGELDIYGPLEGFEIVSVPHIDPQEFE